jgi:hypothetical protein
VDRYVQFTSIGLQRNASTTQPDPGGVMNERERLRARRIAAASGRTMLIRLSALSLALMFVAQTALAAPPLLSPEIGQALEMSGAGADDPIIEDLEQRTFRYFWETTNKKNGLAPDRFPTKSFVSIAAVGFALTSYVVGAERQFVSRAQAGERTVRTLRFLANAPQGPEASGMAGHKGFYYHFLNPEDGLRFSGSELSTVDTGLLLGGVLLAQSYFDGRSRVEREIRELADHIYQRVDWQWAQSRPPAISHGWRPETGFLTHDWDGYNEAMLIYILALGSPTHPVQPEAWKQWTRSYDENWGQFGGQEHLSFGPLFGHQYSHVWIDFHGIQDEYMRDKGIDYFENSRRAAYAQREYANLNPMKWRGYDSQIWGLSACDGPADTEQVYNGQKRGFYGYAGRGTAAVHALDDGTIAPTAAIASIAFAPEIVIPTIHSFRERYGTHLYKKYGFLDSINPSFTYTDVKMQYGQVIADVGWVATDYIGIDQGAILAMIENYRSGLIWKIMRRNRYIQQGLERAGFSGGWMTQLTQLAAAESDAAPTP